jgi:hypothetical protein
MVGEEPEFIWAQMAHMVSNNRVSTGARRTQNIDCAALYIAKRTRETFGKNLQNRLEKAREMEVKEQSVLNHALSRTTYPINAMGFVVDERYHRGTRFYGTTDGVRFTSILDFCGVGLPFFKAFVTENMQKKQMRDFVKPYYAERIRAYQAGETAELEVPPLVQAIMGKLHNQHPNPSTEAGGSADVEGSHSQVAIQKTFGQPRLGTKRVSTASHEDRRVMLTIA